MRFAILGYGKIASEVMFQSILAAGHAVTVIGSERGASPDGFDGRVVRDYFKALEQDEFDAVYIGLPNHLHHDTTLAALERKRPVLCEKPLGLTARQVSNLVRCSTENKTLLREAFMVAHHPQWDWMRSEIGNDQQIDLSVQFHYDNRDSLNIRNRPETGGGARLDIGCYALWVADRFGARTQNDLYGYQIYENGVDVQSFGSIWFHEGVQLNFDVSMRRARFQQVVVQTQNRCWIIPRPFNPMLHSVVWTMDQFGNRRETSFEANQYELMIQRFCRDIEQGCQTDLSSSLRIAEWSDNISSRFEKRLVG